MNKQLTAIVLSRYFCTNKFHFAYYSDSVGVRTQDPQLRRLLLYPAELPDHPYFRGAKVRIFLFLANF